MQPVVEPERTDISEQRRQAMARLGYETKSTSDLVFGRTTAAKLIGLTPARLDKLLRPCDTAINPYYKSGPPVGLYCPLELERISKDPEVAKVIATLKEKRPAREEAAQRAVQKKREQALEELNSIIHRKKWHRRWPKTYTEAVRQACARYNERKDYLAEAATVDSDPAFLRRITENYIRHERTNYDDILDEFAGVVGIDDVYDRLKSYILRRIATYYGLPR